MLRKKMFRDIKKNLSQFITIFLMVLIGVMVYTGIEAYMSGMSDTADRFYSENNLFDLQAVGNNFTKEDIQIVKNMDNVNDAERKLSVTATSNDDKVLLLNVIESNNISKFYVVKGIEFDANKVGVWLDNYYATSNNLTIGDTIKIKYDNLSLDVEILGLINVPDHVYDTKDESELYPDRLNFGFAYISLNTIPEEYRNHLAFNYLMVDVEDNNYRDKVKEDIEDNVSNALAIINVNDISSYRTYQGEIDEGKTYVGVFSGLFIFIAMLSVITTMTRIIKNQRVQIGTLKALGFSNKKVLLHYIGYGFYISLFGVIAGLILGYYGIGNIFINLEMSFFEIPNGRPLMNNNSYILGLIVILLVMLITYITGRNILKENPAETLRNKIPNVKKGSLNITKKKIFKKLNFSSIWNIRDILRNKTRTIMGIVGVVGCAMLIVCALGMLDSMNHFIKLQFTDLYNFDYKVSLKENINNAELSLLENKYGSDTSETLGIEIKTNDKRETNNIVVTDANDKLRFINNKDKFININSNKGVYITYKLAKNNNLTIGDNITWHIYGSDTYYTSEIVGFNKDPQNQNMTMTREYLESLGITYKPDSLYTNTKVKDNEIGIELVQDKNKLKDSMSSMLSMMKTMISLIIVIAILLGVIIIYNLGILSFSEKEYQFATLKVLGFDDSKIKKIFIKQNNWIAIISIIIGLPLGYALVNYLFKVAIEEHYDFSAYITLLTYLLSAIGTFVTSYVVSRLLSRKVNKIDMVSSLKANE